MQIRWFRTNVLRNSLAITIECLEVGRWSHVASQLTRSQGWKEWLLLLIRTWSVLHLGWVSSYLASVRLRSAKGVENGAGTLPSVVVWTHAPQLKVNPECPFMLVSDACWNTWYPSGQEEGCFKDLFLLRDVFVFLCGCVPPVFMSAREVQKTILDPLKLKL